MFGTGRKGEQTRRPTHYGLPMSGLRTASHSRENARVELARRMRNRMPDIEDALLARARNASDNPQASQNPHLARDLRRLIADCLECWLLAIEHGSTWPGAVPPAAVAHARLITSKGTSLATYLQQGISACALALNIMLEEISNDLDQPIAELLRETLTTTMSLIGDTTREAAAAHVDDLTHDTSTRYQRISELVGRILAGYPISPEALSYDFDLHHICFVSAHASAAETFEVLAERLGCQILWTDTNRGRISAWLGHRRARDPEEFAHALRDAKSDVTAGISNSTPGVAGFRLAHWQAQTTFAFMDGSRSRTMLFADIAHVAPLAGHDMAIRSLDELYLAPLRSEKDGGAALRDTLRAYFACRCNATSAAAALDGISRRTVENRIRLVEQKLGGRPLGQWRTGMEFALFLDALNFSA